MNQSKPWKQPGFYDDATPKALAHALLPGLFHREFYG